MTWWLSKAYGKSRYSADVYNSTAPWTKSQKNSSKNVKTTKGYFRNEHLVTHKFHGTKSTPTTNKANQFNIKIGGVERVFYNLSSDAFGDLIMKQAEYYNAMNELNYFDLHDKRRKRTMQRKQIFMSSKRMKGIVVASATVMSRKRRTTSTK